LGFAVALSRPEASVTDEAASVVTDGCVGGVVNDKTSPSVIPIELEAMAQK
jgi:hypothetical protein